MILPTPWLADCSVVDSTFDTLMKPLEVEVEVEVRPGDQCLIGGGMTPERP